MYVKPDGTSYMSVTTLLKQLPNEGLEQWKRRVGPKQAAKISKEATVRGTALHSAAEGYLRNTPLVITDPLKKAAFSQIVPLLDRIDNIRLIETALYSDQLRLAGTPDCIADFDSELSIIDFKTSTRIKEEKYVQSYYMQLAAYAYMFKQHYGILPRWGVIIMSVDESSQPQFFKKPIPECFKLLSGYVKDLNNYRDANYTNLLA